MYKWLPAKKEDAALLALNLAPDIAEELTMLNGKTPKKAIELAIVESDEAWSVFNAEGIIAIFGIKRTSLLSDTGVPWLMVSNLIFKHRKNFLKATPIALSYWLKKYTVLESYVPAKFNRLLKWAKWAGFTISPVIFVPLHKEHYHKIEMRK